VKVLSQLKDLVLSLFLSNELLNRIKRYSIIAGISLISCLFLLLGAGFLFEDEILDKVRAQVNEQLEVPIEVAEMDFSLLSHFPQASISFHDLRIPDKLEEGKDLLRAKELSLHFDIWDLITGNYVLNTASVSHAELRMHADPRGEVNYIFWKASSDSLSDVSFALEEFILKDVKFQYLDEETVLDLSAHISDAVLDIQFKDDLIEIHSDLKAEAASVSYGLSTYVEESPLRYEGSMTISSDGKDTRFANSKLKIAEVPFTIQGRVNERKGAWMVDFSIASETELEELIPELPQSYRDALIAYEALGSIEFQLYVKGVSSKGLYPAVDASFKVSDGKFGRVDSKDRIKKVTLKGSYSRDGNGKDLLTLNESQGDLKAGRVSYRGTVKDLSAPYIDGKLELEGELKDFLALMEEPPMSACSGAFELSVDLKGKLPKEGFKASDAAALGMKGQLNLEDIAFTLNDDGYHIEDLYGEVLLHGDDLLFDPLKLKCNGTAMELSGSISGLIAHLTDEKNSLSIKAKLISEEVDWRLWAKAANDAEPGEPARIPEHIDLALEMDLKGFKYANFIAENVKGSISVKENQIVLNPISFKTCKGELLANLNMFQKADDSWTMHVSGDLRNMDIAQVFREFDHFGQEFITDKHLKGRGNAHLNLSASLNPALDLDLNTLLADIDITLDEGELIEHPSMIDIIAAMRDQRMTRSFVRIEELEKEMHHLKFKQLRNSIHIANGRIAVPEMLIANNVMDLRISGTQTFKNDIDYTVSFSMRDVLINKKNPEFLIQDDGLGHVLNMRMYGTTDHPIIELDKGKAKENRKEAITEAKSDVKDFFKDPLGRKKDAANTKTDIVLEVEEQSGKSQETPVLDSKKKKWWNSPQSTEEVKKAPVIIVDDDF